MYYIKGREIGKAQRDIWNRKYHFKAHTKSCIRRLLPARSSPMTFFVLDIT